jgi:hypothetical protein
VVERRDLHEVRARGGDQVDGDGFQEGVTDRRLLFG